jgi:hypothetical protein
VQRGTGEEDGGGESGEGDDCQERGEKSGSRGGISKV